MALYKIKKSNIDNKGLVAAKNIKKGTKIIEYKGKLISKKESEVNPKFDNSKRIYLFEINKKWVHPRLKRHIKRLILTLPKKNITSIKQI